ncbi:ATP-binding cassette domain-containing protein [Variovorax sp. J22G73]|uniref:ABC transporter ATP-binding protein n=1 Tax=unclassified Variovorax TaxID=663243 RepID=UPI0025762E11|nr:MULTISPECIES: ATP-binding cassette domain-containing protein [unclassified Variovorax]MDM0008131.1 ATP-binding cassette domain-containing protein [Variovorax sp. J22R203]MDM0100637.1 ATP-binding cassette domain-containing protein [Variovorax sp. J22G73]
MAQRPLLEVHDLVARYALPGVPSFGGLVTQRRWLQAVDGVSFTLARGEAVGLVGESGCGKSTLVSLLARLADPVSGRIVFDGIELADQPAAQAAKAPWRHRVQMVFQDPHDSLDPRRTAFDAIADPLRSLRGLRGDALRQRVLDVAQRVQLGADLLQRRPHELSGGQAARVGIARALAPEPELLILDEPTAALDVSVQAGVLALLDRLRRELGLAIVFVSHDLGVVRLLCERVLVMREGRIVDQGPARELLDRPRHAYTAALAVAIPRFPERANS